MTVSLRVSFEGVDGGRKHACMEALMALEQQRNQGSVRFAMSDGLDLPEFHGKTREALDVVSRFFGATHDVSLQWGEIEGGGELDLAAQLAGAGGDLFRRGRRHDPGQTESRTLSYMPIFY